MKQDNINLVLKDLSGRLPYKPKFKFGNNVYTLYGIDYCVDDDGKWVHCLCSKGIAPMEIHLCQPYLFPLSSITEEQFYDFYCRFIENDIDYADFKEYYVDGNMWHELLTTIDDCDGVVDWFNERHIDYRGLIPNGLAKDATGLGIY